MNKHGNRQAFSAGVLRLDCAAEADKITACIRDALRRRLRRQGLVVAMSGGIDSSVVAALSVRAVGKERVLRAPPCPTRISSPATWRLSRAMADTPRRPDRPRGHNADARCRRLLPLPGRGHPPRHAPASRPPGSARSSCRAWRTERLPAFLGGGAAAEGPTSQDAPRCARLPGHRRRHQLQAARPQDARVLPRGPPQLRRHGHARTASSTTRASS
ncbi:MAG: hypothetical protein MZV70_05505 [Desulfobacterales bacterium]|nr:hypothetical protein [Desulfobacterales bacterium]